MGEYKRVMSTKQAKQRVLRRLIFVATAVAAIVCSLNAAFENRWLLDRAEASPKDDDFGAETVEEDAVPLPVDQVEQRDRKRAAADDASGEAAGNAALKQRVVMLLAEGEKAWGAGAVAVPRNGTIAGAKIFGIKPDSIFVTFGLKEGDVLRTLGGTPITGQEDLSRILEAVVAQDTVVLEVERDGKEIVVPITTGAPSAATEDSAAIAAAGDVDTTTVLNVNDVEITALVKTFSKLTKRNYIVDSNVKGKITVHLPSPVTLPEALRILDAVLLLKGFTTVPVEKNTWKVVNAKDARQTTIPLVKAPKDSPSDVMVTQLIRLKYLTASDIQQLLTQFVSKDGVINAFGGTNSLVLIDSQANIQRLQALIKELDVPALDQEITIIPIIHAEAKDIAEKIEDILGEKDKDKGAGNDPQQTRRAQIANQLRQPPIGDAVAQNASAAGGSVERRALPLKIIADERTNSIIVVADPELTIKVRALIDQLDTKLDQSGGRFWVHRLQHADSEELSDVLNALISGNTSGLGARRDGRNSGSSISRNNRSSAGSRFGERQSSNSALNRLQNNQQRTPTLNNAAGGIGGASGDGAKNSFEGEVTIAPDAATNSLIINASRSDYLRLKEVIDELDVKRRQVLVEATILEVSIDNEEGLGVELQGTAGTDNGGIVGQTNFGGLTNLLTNPAALTDLTIAAASTGTLTLPGGVTIPSQAVLVTAVSRLTNVNVLSTPTILSTDNEEAEIIVGENVPFVSSTSTDTSNIQNTFNSIERQDVGITLRITPQISSGDFVVLKIFVEVSGVVERTRNDPNGPSTTINTTETTVTVKDKQMIVTGGLISDNQEDATRGVPFLQDIPVLGQLFQRSNSRDRRKNLLVFITPRVITDQFDARETTRERADKAENDIARMDLLPDREDILRSKAIDRVTSAEVSDPAKGPSTITPPTDREALAKKRTEDRLKQLITVSPSSESEVQTSSLPPVTSNGDTPIGEGSLDPMSGSSGGSDVSESDVLELKVQPKLPAPRGSSGGSAARSSTSKAAPAAEVSGLPSSGAARLASAPNGASAVGERAYVVLRQVRPKGSPGSSDLVYADTDKTVGVMVLGSLNSPAAQFFQVGSTYVYRGSAVGAPGASESTYVCLGVYGSNAEAGIVHQPLKEISRWNDMSPAQVLTLGKPAAGASGWKRG